MGLVTVHYKHLASVDSLQQESLIGAAVLVQYPNVFSEHIGCIAE